MLQCSLTRLASYLLLCSRYMLQVLSPPESLVHLRQDDAALGPTDCLVGLLRAQSTVSAMVTLPAPEQGRAQWPHLELMKRYSRSRGM
jgi:hypothetical protein